MKLMPLQDWAVIRPSDADEMTAGGLYIPDTAKDKPHEGVVEAIGPGALEEEKRGKKKEEKKERRFIPTVIKPGDLVLYERYAGQTYTIGGEERIMVRERDILGVLTGREPRRVTGPASLQIPAVTTASGSTALATRGVSALSKQVLSAKKAVKKASKKSAKKAAKKAVKKTVKKAMKKTMKKTVKPSSKTVKGRKTSAKKAGKKK